MYYSYPRGSITLRLARAWRYSDVSGASLHAPTLPSSTVIKRKVRWNRVVKHAAVPVPHVFFLNIVNLSSFKVIIIKMASLFAIFLSLFDDETVLELFPLVYWLAVVFWADTAIPPAVKFGVWLAMLLAYPIVKVGVRKLLEARDRWSQDRTPGPIPDLEANAPAA